MGRVKRKKQGRRLRVRILRKLRDKPQPPVGGFSKTNPADGRPMIVSGFGSFFGQSLIGRLVDLSKDRATVQLSDEDGEYEEAYRLSDGKRLTDISLDDGWRIRPQDTKDESKSEMKLRLPPCDAKIDLLHREHEPLHEGSDELAVAEVWQVGEDKFLCTYRQKLVGKRLQRQPMLIPFDVLKRVLLDFETDW